MKGQALKELAQIYLAMDDLERARKITEEALAEGRRAGTMPVEAEARIVLATVLAYLDHASYRLRIDEALAEAERLIEGMGAVLLNPRLHEARAALAGCEGDEERQRSELDEAQRLYATMGAGGHARRVALLAERITPQLES